MFTRGYPADSWRTVRNTSLAWSKNWDPSTLLMSTVWQTKFWISLHVAWRGIQAWRLIPNLSWSRKIPKNIEFMLTLWRVAARFDETHLSHPLVFTCLHPPPGCVRESSYLVSWKIQRLRLQVPNAEDVHGLYLAALANLTCFDTFSQSATALELMLKWIKMEMVCNGHEVYLKFIHFSTACNWSAPHSSAHWNSGLRETTGVLPSYWAR